MTTCVGRGMASGQKVGSHFPHLAGRSFFQSPQGSWQFIVTSSTVAVLLLLVLTLLMVLYFRKARRNTRKGKPQCWLRADHPGLSHDTPVPASLRRRLPVPILPTRKLRPVRRSGQDPLGSLALSEIALFGGSRSAAFKPNLPKTGCSSPFGSVYFAIFLQDFKTNSSKTFSDQQYCF